MKGTRNAQNSVRAKGNIDGRKVDVFRLSLGARHVERVDLSMTIRRRRIVSVGYRCIDLKDLYTVQRVLVSSNRTFMNISSYDSCKKFEKPVSKTNCIRSECT